MLVSRPSRRAWAYVAAVGALSAVGFVQASPAPIVAAAVLSLPWSLATVPSYYVVYGLLSLVPGANPSSSSGTGASTSDGAAVVSVVSGEPAVWFTTTTHVIGILALIIAALLDVVLLRAVRSRRRTGAVGGRPPAS